MQTFFSIFLSIVFTLYIIIHLLQYFIKKGVNSDSRKLNWVRKILWKTLLNRFESQTLGNYKVEAYFIKYLRDSVAAREFYIKHGHTEFRVEVINKIEDLERFVEKYKYNTFDNLTMWEEDFIDNYEKRKRRRHDDTD